VTGPTYVVERTQLQASEPRVFPLKGADPGVGDRRNGWSERASSDPKLDRRAPYGPAGRTLMFP
jgi:hypothetical protein